MSLQSESLAIAKTQIGAREDPPNSNRGPQVEQYLASVGLPGGNPWCAAFTYWCISQAAEKLVLPCPIPKTGYTPSIHQWSLSRGKSIAPAEVAMGKIVVQPGALFLLWGNVEGVARVKHIGFVEAVIGLQVRTVEGNTDPQGSREGGGVFCLTRTLDRIFRFVTY